MCQKQCIVCGRSIPDVAQVCPECGKYQSKGKNALVFFGSIVAALSFFLAASLYLYSEATYYTRMFFIGDIITYYEFRTNSKAAFHNAGYRKIFISRVIAKSNDLPFDIIETIHRDIEPGETLVIDVGERVKAIFFPFAEEEDKYKALNKADPELILGVVSQNTPAYLQAKERYKNQGITLPEFTCEAHIYFVPDGADETKKEMACSIVILSTSDDYLKKRIAEYLTRKVSP